MGSVDSVTQKSCVAGSQSCAQVGYQGRTADMIQVTGDMGGFSIKGQTEFDGTDGASAWAVATEIDFGSLAVGASYRDDGAQCRHLQVCAGSIANRIVFNRL